MTRLLVTAAHKSSGKTSVAIGLCAALARRGRVVQPFKKGPDYIDPIWLGRAAGRPCYNLDFQVQTRDEITVGFGRRAGDADVAVVEGNKGLYDGLDVEGSNSNAALAHLLDLPVVLVLDTRGTIRGVAPLLLGYRQFDPALRFAGVILNLVGGARHEAKLRAVIERYTDMTVLGALPRDEAVAIGERHLGLVPANESDAADARIAALASAVERGVDLGALLERCATPAPIAAPPAAERPGSASRVRIGIARDRAFAFYYPDDLEMLAGAGADLVPIDTLRDTALPELDGLFLGGGFPETSLDALAANVSLRAAIRSAIEGGLPTYAECGGLMYLARRLHWHDTSGEMVGVIPADVHMEMRPVGRGYVRLRETDGHPWPSSPGVGFHAHEFHYSRLVGLPEGLTYAYQVERGHGIDGGRDGLVLHNLLASYAHLRDTAGHRWARAFVDFVRRHATAHATAHRGETV
ncbi:MAG: cobyrinate a,c-diamide synthase [Gammaproteobacteria bacterium]|nr:cobyrinate a,c-diamide synthase [Gammaproteobacteria bacterium]